MNRFEGRVAVVTGGSRGIGKAVTDAYVREGARVAILDVDEGGLQAAKEQFEQQGHSFLTIKTDVTSESDVEHAVQLVKEKFGKIDILVNNAGVIRDNLLFRMSNDDWDTVMNVHLKGAFLATRAVQQIMVDNRYGRIVNLSSTSALGNRGQANYSAAKAGLQGFTKTLAIELGKYGITANAIAPGFIKTEMTKATAERLGVPFEARIEEASNRIPVQRVGTPEDVAHLALFLTEEASSFLSGQVIYLAGGPKA